MNISKFLLFAFFILLGFQSQVYAAFPVKVQTAEQDSATISGTANEENATAVTTSYTQAQTKQSFFQRLFHSGNHDGGRRFNLRLAINLCLLGVLGIFGIHRLYLGYTWQGLLQFSGSLAWLAAFFIIISTPLWAAVPAGVGLLVGYGCIMALWQLIDFLRLISNDLRPNKGNYQGGGGGRRRQYPGRYY